MEHLKFKPLRNQELDAEMDRGDGDVGGCGGGDGGDDQLETTTLDQTENRGRFASRAESILYCIGFAVGIGDVWRFPFLVYQNGGGAFFFAYCLLMVLVACPLYCMELALGQFSSLGPIAVWRCLPVGRGIGIGMVIISLSVAVYYNVILAYTLFYLGQSMRSQLPWESCHEWWGADLETCFVRSSGVVLCRNVERILWNRYNSIGNNTILDNVETTHIIYDGVSFAVPAEEHFVLATNCSNATQTAAEQFWERYVLDLSPDINHIGSIKWDLAFCLFVSWAIVFLCLIRGVSSSGKVVYFTATFPYVVLSIFLVKGVTLSGSFEGIKYFLVPDFAKLANFDIWRKAAEQLFYSLGIAWGGLIMSGSYNNFRSTIKIDATIVIIADVLTSFIGGIAIFAVLGHMSLIYGLPIEEVAKAGQGLAFVVFPEAMTTFWCPPLWSFIFFVMLYLLGIDSEFPLVQTCLTVISDHFPVVARHRGIAAFIACTCCFFIGLLCVTQGGQYVLNLMDTYCAGVSLLFMGMCEVMALMWFYGVNNFSSDLKFMLGEVPGWFFKGSWAIFSPILLVSLVMYAIIDWKPIKYNNVEPYPYWADCVGWVLAAIPMVQVPIWACVVLFKRRKRIRTAFEPSESWGPADPVLFKEYRKLRRFQASDFDTELNNIH